MRLDLAVLSLAGHRQSLEWCELDSFDPHTGLVLGTLKLRNGKRIPLFVGNAELQADVSLEIRKVTTTEDNEDGRYYVFEAQCSPEFRPALDMLLNSAKHPTILEFVMQ